MILERFSPDRVESVASFEWLESTRSVPGFVELRLGLLGEV